MATTVKEQTAVYRAFRAVTAGPGEQADVVALRDTLDDLLHSRHRGSARGELVVSRGRHAPIPGSVLRALERIARAMARGERVAVVPLGRHLTTQQAADILDVSRQYLVRLVDEGRIPAARTGTHRRLRLDDVLAFKDARDRARRASLRAITRITEAAGGYDAELE